MEKRDLSVGTALLVLVVALGIGQAWLEPQASAQVKHPTAGLVGQAEAPMYEVDPFWPKPLPHNWVMSATIGIWADKQDNIWVLNRGTEAMSTYEMAKDRKEGFCCASAPYILRFDTQGNLLSYFLESHDNVEFEWPTGDFHGLHIDYKGNVWLGTMSETILKFSATGKFLMQVGKNDRLTGGKDGYESANSLNMQDFLAPTKMFVDPKRNETWVSDGYGHKRVVLIDADTGKFKRVFGAYGNKPDDSYWGYNTAEMTEGGPTSGRSGSRFELWNKAGRPPAPQFSSPVHCVMMSNDDLVYVCDRAGNRIQVFTPDGKFVKEGFFGRGTLASGTTWDMAFSPDPQQTFIYVGDGTNQAVYVGLRDTLETLTVFGGGGHEPSQFAMLHNLTVDSKSNVYTSDTWEGHRIQKFRFKGIGEVDRNQGVLWPDSAK